MAPAACAQPARRAFRVLEGAGDFRKLVIIGATPFRALITLLITYLLSPLPLQVLLFVGGSILESLNPEPRTL